MEVPTKSGRPTVAERDKLREQVAMTTYRLEGVLQSNAELSNELNVVRESVVILNQQLAEARKLTAHYMAESAERWNHIKILGESLKAIVGESR